MVTEVTKEERSEDKRMDGDDVLKFVRLFIASVFRGNLKEETPEDARQESYNLILGLCAARGVHDFLRETKEENFTDLVELYSCRTTEFMGLAEIRKAVRAELKAMRERGQLELTGEAKP